MRVLCRNGHFAFYPKLSTDLYGFKNDFGISLVRDGDFYTFPFLKAAPRYSLAGKTYLGLSAGFSYEGRAPWDVMGRNSFVYSIASSRLVAIASVTARINPLFTGELFVAETPLVQPGSINAAGLRVLSYDAIYSEQYHQLRVMGFEYV